MQGARRVVLGGSAAWKQTIQHTVRTFSEATVADVPKHDPYYQSPTRQRFGRLLALTLPASLAGVLAWGYLYPDDDSGSARSNVSPHQIPTKGETIVNWSATHTTKPKFYYQPETVEDVEAIVADSQSAKRRLRVVGSALSPNGLGFSDEGMMSMALLDNIMWVDKDKQQVRVQAGCRVQQVADYLKPYGLSLQNYASIREQQIGGFIQVSAHGTGPTIPPVDEQVISMKVVTPGLGTLELSRTQNPELFDLARVGLGCLGVVTEVTLQCVARHQLKEETFTASREEVEKNHSRWLRNNKHLRYMWIPYTDTVVVVKCNLTTTSSSKTAPASSSTSAAAPGAEQSSSSGFSLDERLAPLRQLLLEATGVGGGEVGEMSATELRDALLVLNPLDKTWVARVNRAEAEYWKRSSGSRVGFSDEILGFDCGGQQWVLEVAFPIGSLGAMKEGWFRKTQHKDLQYMHDLLQEINTSNIPAPAPIEQRWTSSSSAPMSPASYTHTTAVAAAGASSSSGSSSSKNGVDIAPDSVHSWVGIIMYLPTEEEGVRQAITDRFKQYSSMVQTKMMPAYNAVWHWAKIEPPEDKEALAAMRATLAARYPLESFNAARKRVDPDNILANDLVDKLIS